MTKKLRPYPYWVCRDCGSKASKKGQYSISTWNQGKCDVCGNNKEVTQPRDFFYPEFKGHEK